ncbi:MAG: hypothetical protein AAGD32_16370, partial [Planctomycetota bacterium]
MPHWWNWLCRWASLHARKEAVRDHLRYAYPGVNPQRQQAPVEPLEPRMLLSSVPTLLPERNPDAGGTLKILDASHRVNTEALGSLAPGRLKAINRIDAKQRPAEPTDLRVVAGSAADDILLGFSPSGDFRGGDGRDTIAVLPTEDGAFSKAKKLGRIDAGAGDDVVYVYDAAVTVDGGSGYDILFTNRGDLKYQDVEEVWVKNAKTGRFEQTFDPVLRQSFFGGSGFGAQALTAYTPLVELVDFGDLNADGTFDTVDIDDLYKKKHAYEIAAAAANVAGSPNVANWDTDFAPYDILPDGVIDVHDVNHLILGLRSTLLGETQFGDETTDGQIEQTELNAVLNNWGDIGNGYAGGDFVQDHSVVDPLDPTKSSQVEQSDLNVALNNWGKTDYRGQNPASSTGNDFIYTLRGYRDFAGNPESDLITGDAGDDFLFGGLNEDTIDGGTGADILVAGSFLNSAPESNTITDPDLVPLGLSPETGVPGIVAYIPDVTVTEQQTFELDLHFANPTDAALVHAWEVHWGDGTSDTYHGLGTQGITALAQPPSWPPSHFYTSTEDRTVKVRAITQLGEPLGQWEVDTSFNNDKNSILGLASIFIPDGDPKRDIPEAIAIDSSGRIVLGGRNFDAVDDYDAAIARFLSDGTVDDKVNDGTDIVRIGFNVDGSHTVSRAAEEAFVGLAIDGSDRITAATEFIPEDTLLPAKLAVVHFDANGNPVNPPDAASKNQEFQFIENASGTGDLLGYAVGSAHVQLPPEPSNPTGPVRDRLVIAGIDGSTMIAARVNIESDSQTNQLPASLNDDDYGTNGVVTQDVGQALDYEAAAAGVDHLGRFIVAASTTGGDIALTRFTAGGIVDATFNSGSSNPGYLVADLTHSVVVEDVATDRYGRIYVTGQTTIANATDGLSDTQWFVARFNDSGLDTTFGASGIYTTSFVNPNETDPAAEESQPTSAHSLLITPSQRILVGGNDGAGNWALLTLFPDGQEDTTADDETPGNPALDLPGITRLEPTGAIRAIQLLDNGQILVAGDALTGTPAGGDSKVDFAVQRLDAWINVQVDVEPISSSQIVINEGRRLVSTNDGGGGLDADTTFQLTPQAGVAEALKIDFSALSFADALSGIASQDAFEIALLNANGDSLVSTIGSGSDAFFNLTQTDAGLSVNLADGVALRNASDTDFISTVSDSGVVYLDVRDVPDATEARLVARLVNNDGSGGVATDRDDASTVTVDFNFAQGVTPGLFAWPTGAPTATGTAEAAQASLAALRGALDTPALTDVTDSFAITYGFTGYDEDPVNPRLHHSVSIEKLDDGVGIRGDLILAIRRLTHQDQEILVGDLNHGVAVTPGRTGTGYLMYSRTSVHDRFIAEPPDSNNANHLIAVVYQNDAWHYDTGSALEAFTPTASDILVASLNHGTNSYGLLTGQTGEVEGITQGLIASDFGLAPLTYNGAPSPNSFSVTGAYFTPNEAETETDARVGAFDGLLPASVAGVPTGTPYLQLRDLLPKDFASNGAFYSPNGTVENLLLSFADVNPNERFDYELVILGAANRAPYFTSTPHIYAEEALGQAYVNSAGELELQANGSNSLVYTLAGEDPDGDDVHFVVTEGPAAIDPADGVTLRYTPADNSTGSVTIKVRVRDEFGHFDAENDQTFTLNVIDADATNEAPEFRTEPTRHTKAGETYTYDSFAFDPDDDAVLYTGTLTYTDPETQQTVTLDGSEALDPQFVVASASGLVTWADVPHGLIGEEVSLTVIANDQQTPPLTGIQTRNILILDSATPPVSTGDVDLVASNIDTSGVTFHPQTLTTQGVISVDVANLGPGTVMGPFEVLIFEDTDMDGEFTPGQDQVFGTSTVYDRLAAHNSDTSESSATVTLAVQGSVDFAGAPIWAWVDSGDAVNEVDETNNTIFSDHDCGPLPQFSPSVTPLWTTNASSGGSFSRPLVIDLNDDHLPEVVFVEASTFGPFKVRAITAATG